jgi:hypothetical protein
MLEASVRRSHNKDHILDLFRRMVDDCVREILLIEGGEPFSGTLANAFEA